MYSKYIYMHTLLVQLYKTSKWKNTDKFVVTCSGRLRVNQTG